MVEYTLQAMKIAIVSRFNEKLKWGGDLKALQVVRDGMRELGHKAEIIPDLTRLKDHEYIFLSSTFFDLRPNVLFLKLAGRKYGVIAFHDDFIKYSGLSYGFYRYIRGCLDGEEDDEIPFQLERLFENPELVHYYATPPGKSAFINYDTLKHADLCIANSPTEARTLLRDCPSCNAKVVYWTPGFAETEEEPTDEFLKFTGLRSGEYILQVGRFHQKKNHLGSILATKDLDIPLVFIATTAADFPYERTCLEAAHTFRKAPTYIIHQKLPTMMSDKLRILHMPNGRKISPSMLLSAFAHAGLHLHPAFYELPGYTYLESTKLGIPTIASSWTSIRDYFTDPHTGKYTLDDRMEYVVPYDVPGIAKLVKKKFGQKYSRNFDHPIFKRRSIDVARDIMLHIES